jgi:hypothetical protein
VAIVRIGVSALAIAAVVATAPTVGSSRPGPGPRLEAVRGVNFVSVCRFSHRLPDDPIVSPGVPGASHDHSFVANTSTNAHSTVRSLLRASTTCNRPADTAAYWMPTLLVNGAPVAPVGATIYYRRNTLGRVRPFPLGLKVIAGDGHATSPQSLRVTFWNCGAQAGVPLSSTVPTCPNDRRTSLRLHVKFPSCWDGRNHESLNHQSHMAYAMRGSCPETHPVAVPAIALIFRYPTAGGSAVTLSSGGQYSAHADFFNAWQPGALRTLVERCLNALRHCGPGR